MKPTALLLLLLPATILAQGFEESPVLSAAAILRPEFAVGVRDAVPTYGGRNHYVIDSDYGTFVADGNAMLVRRTREIAAIARLREVSRTDEYKSALAAATASPLLVAKGLVTNPVGTVTGLPKGLWKFMNRAGQSIKETTERRPQSEFEDSGMEQMIGFSKTKREVALKLGVDPYTTNEALQRELNGVSWAAFAGQMTFTLATAPVGGGAGMALTAVAVTAAFDGAIRDQSPTDLRLANLKKLLSMDVSRADADAFLNNPDISPSVQTAIVLHIAALEGVENRSSFIRLVVGGVSDESDANFFCETSRILAQLHTNGRTLARLQALGGLPIAFGSDGALIVALEWDYAAWTSNAADFVALVKSAKFDGRQPTARTIAISGDASPTVVQKLQDAGINLAARISPGPLQ